MLKDSDWSSIKMHRRDAGAIQLNMVHKGVVGLMLKPMHSGWIVFKYAQTRYGTSPWNYIHEQLEKQMSILLQK